MEIKETKHHENKIHWLIVHSYTVYFVLFLVGIYLDFVFDFKIFIDFVTVPVGLTLLIFATFLILWAQRHSQNPNVDNLSKETFCRGPYCYTRSPNHWGLFFLMLGFGITTNAIFVILSTLVSFLVTRFVFLEKREKILAEKYGTPYVEYQKDVSL